MAKAITGYVDLANGKLYYEMAGDGDTLVLTDVYFYRRRRIIDMSWMCAVCAHFIQRGEVCHYSKVVGAGQMHLIHADVPDAQQVNLLWQRWQTCQALHSIIRSDLWLKLDQNDVPNQRCLPLSLPLHGAMSSRHAADLRLLALDL